MGARSVSDDGEYPNFCARASLDPTVFSRFRSDPGYQRILEHLTPDQGAQLLNRMQATHPALLDPDVLAKVAENDTVGRPGSLMRVGSEVVSPTTLRYLKVATDIINNFDVDQIQSIAEIGVGYGGQVRVLDAVGIGTSYSMFDLAPVLSLATRYLECFVLRGSYRPTTLNQSEPLAPDLVLSMYALSELPRPLQMNYYEKVLKRARSGFMIMNDCWDFDRLTQQEWVEALNAEVRPEDPETGAGNYVLIWGHLQ